MCVYRERYFKLNSHTSLWFWTRLDETAKEHYDAQCNIIMFSVIFDVYDSRGHIAITVKNTINLVNII